MVEGGLKEINLGIETNEETNKLLYDRHISNDLIIEKAFLINKYKDKIYPFYDLLIFNKTETNNSLVKTLELIKKLPFPFDLVPHHLTLGSEVPLYKYLKSKGIVSNAREEKISTSNYHEFDFEEYSNWETFYLNLIVEWMGGQHNDKNYGRIPKRMKDFKINPIFKKYLEKCPNKKLEYEDTLAYLISPDNVITMSGEISILREINNRIGKIKFSNH